MSEVTVEGFPKAESPFEKLIQSPQLPLYFDQIRHILQDEHKRRQRFYDRVSEDDKAEFINGEIVVHTPVKFQHNRVSKNLLVLLDSYVSVNDLGFVGHEKIMISLTRNDYEPDVCFFTKAQSRHFKPDQVRFPTPDFIAEVLSDSTETNDRGVKYQDYAAHGVIEYWIIDPDSQIIEQYSLKDQAYELILEINSGTLKSIAIAGFEIPVRALFDDKEYLRALQRIVQSPS